MTADLNKAGAKLKEGGYTCVLWKGDVHYTSDRRGVAPLLGWLEDGTDLQGFSAADKVVGKAAALLYCLLGITEIYAPVISKAALAVLEAAGITVFYDSLVEGIINRRGDGPCPMETATKEISDPALAPDVIRKTLKALQTR